MRLLTLKSILVATDLDESSRPALRTAARLAPLAGASLHLLHVSAEHTQPGEDQLKELFRVALPEEMEPDDVRVAFGSPAPVIVKHALQVGADVIILGPHRDRMSTAPLGSTAASVVRTAHCPCLVAASELRLPLARVFVPIDDSDAADGVISVALSWASALRPRSGSADLTALHVSHDSASQSAHDAVRKGVERARERSHGAAQVAIAERVMPGSDPASVILREAISAAADLLVMGTRTAHTSPELGSVSAAVARATPCPLLLVPPATWGGGEVS